MGCNVISVGERVLGKQIALEVIQAFLNEKEDNDKSIVDSVKAFEKK